MFQRRRQGEEPKVDLTAMVDVVFLLLIFFMISTTFVESPGISVDLPESSASVVEKQPKELTVYITAKGEIELQGRRLNLPQLRQFLKAEHADADDATFILHADRKVEHGLVVSVMDAAQQAGYQKLAIATERPTGTTDRN